MKHIITTVGTSVYTNFRNEEVRECLDTFNGVSQISPDQFKELNKGEHKASDYTNLKGLDSFKTPEEIIKKFWLKDTYAVEGGWDYEAGSNIPNFNASAEIKSICKIIEKSTDTEFKVYLICSDTAICISAGHLVKAFFEGYTVDGVTFPKPELKNSGGAIATIQDIEICFIEKLQVDNADDFKNFGIDALISYCNNIATKLDKADVIINISGGYKGVIPFLTSYAQIQGFTISYVYEESSKLISIAPYPFDFKNKFYSTGLFLKREYIQLFSEAKCLFNEIQEKTDIELNFSYNEISQVFNNPNIAKFLKYRLGDNFKANYNALLSIKSLYSDFIEKGLLKSVTGRISKTEFGVFLQSLITLDSLFGDLIEQGLIEYFNSAKSKYPEYFKAEQDTRKDTFNCSIEGNEITVGPIDICMQRLCSSLVFAEVKAFQHNNDYYTNDKPCKEDYFWHLKARITEHPNRKSFEYQSIEALYIVYRLKINGFSFDSLKNNSTIKYFRKRFAEDEELKSLNVSFRALGLTIPIENPLQFDYEDWKKDWTKYLYDNKNWEEI
ncbi:MAG: hypothetical protein JJT94_09905 [Bernardetiaceae bacterium]|nr:hypothetical protein [Bernardetiaceae bacterium]